MDLSGTLNSMKPQKKASPGKPIPLPRKIIPREKAERLHELRERADAEALALQAQQARAQLAAVEYEQFERDLKRAEKLADGEYVARNGGVYYTQPN
jgi:hypothetical protein